MAGSEPAQDAVELTVMLPPRLICCGDADCWDCDGLPPAAGAAGAGAGVDDEQAASARARPTRPTNDHSRDCDFRMAFSSRGASPPAGFTHSLGSNAAVGGPPGRMPAQDARSHECTSQPAPSGRMAAQPTIGLAHLLSTCACSAASIAAW